jgi:hypothetical protein
VYVTDLTAAGPGDVDAAHPEKDRRCRRLRPTIPRPRHRHRRMCSDDPNAQGPRVDECSRGARRMRKYPVHHLEQRRRARVGDGFTVSNARWHAGAAEASLSRLLRTHCPPVGGLFVMMAVTVHGALASLFAVQDPSRATADEAVCARRFSNSSPRSSFGAGDPDGTARRPLICVGIG